MYSFGPYLATSKNVIFDVLLCFQPARIDQSLKKKVTADKIIQTQAGLLSSSCDSVIHFHAILNWNNVTILKGLTLISYKPLLNGQLLLSSQLPFPRGWPLNSGSTVVYILINVNVLCLPVFSGFFFL